MYQKKIDMAWPQGRNKAFTMTYDDGNDCDVRLVETMRKYGVKGTFNINAGCWQGRLVSEIAEEYPEAFARWRSGGGIVRAGDGEDTAELSERAKRIFERIAAENDGKTVLVTSHGGLIRSIRCRWQGIPLTEVLTVPHVTTASVTVVEYDPETCTARFLVTGYDEHLRELAENAAPAGKTEKGVV